MIKCMISEMQKLKRTFSKKLIFIAPLATLFICGILGAGKTFQNGAYNWWYTMFLPGALSIICGTIVDKDKKLKYHELFTLPFSKNTVWIGKIIACSFMYLISSIIFVIGIILGGFIFGQIMSFSQIIEGMIVLFITFLWQIPLCMMLCGKFGMVSTVLINMVANVIGVGGFSDSANWYLYPFSIPSRLMCSILNILPNGFPVEKGSFLLNTNVIIPGIIISLVCFIGITALTGMWFNNQEGI
ncbi:ABC-2 family transporter protein [Clostridium saccharobutylicum]|uniref:lantibiotic immunity ABC transporter MutE/EpiE family permease subunit n=1 Tax=Clostridium saccharobutylicum TaxID=169679 RepID=UPI0009838CAD|nr:lantibiotic immunity ABC transporter MutE/EpiE family permease subunit [Clostridium saccharobutylicum]AQS10279.1 ABC-2 family transporter protein [Clostridium saccharobutylicum]MBC2436545.1 lantibiotic immunity ABC transporter MutE/EpiE family permease subunit [Clostridium saccharobutylicum]NSB87677.1 ABC-2 type transport system permease protein [Clostridium saccharobutylicum]NYC31213.1 ABC-2 type transport system permease protein [Clostridium saccharobutylicum]OOM17444.1 ABC-2 family trans